jgi:hypothetical protein
MVPGINLEIERFTGSWKNLNSPFQVLPMTQEDLALALFTVGRKDWPDTLKGGKPREMEILSLILQAYAYTEMKPKGLSASDLYSSLEQSEKGAASYRLGMALAKFVCDIKLGIPWLRHISPLISAGVIQTSNSHKQGDLIGLDPLGQFHVVEAKGRFYTPSAELKNEAKQQANSIMKISGRKPATRCASIAHLGSLPFHVSFYDPKEFKETKPVKLSIDRIAFLREYYSIFDYLLKQESLPFESERHTRIISKYNLNFDVIRLPFTNISIGCGFR